MIKMNLIPIILSTIAEKILIIGGVVFWLILMWAVIFGGSIHLDIPATLIP